MDVFKFQSPTSIAIFTPSFSGKSTLTIKILENADSLFHQPPEFVVHCYKECLPMFDDMKDLVRELILHQGVPSRKQMEEWAQGRHFNLVLDDLQQVCENKRDVAEMFTVGSHHSYLYMSQHFWSWTVCLTY